VNVHGFYLGTDKIDHFFQQGYEYYDTLKHAQADIYEGGHRVPFVVRWPGVVASGKTDRLVGLVDVFRTLAEITGATVPDDAAEDSASFAAVLRGEKDAGRRPLVHHSVNGSFAIRDGAWKLCLCPGSGGWSEPRPGKGDAKLPQVQLFDLSVDRAETTNLQAKEPDRVKRLTAELEKLVADGRSTPGKPQKNTTPVDVGKAAGK